MEVGGEEGDDGGKLDFSTLPFQSSFENAAPNNVFEIGGLSSIHFSNSLPTKHHY